jgi:hypothetical protein
MKKQQKSIVAKPKVRKQDEPLKIHGTLEDVLKAAVAGNPKGKRKR